MWAFKRASVPHLQSRLNLLMTRLAACADPLVDVVYVAPMDVPDDVRNVVKFNVNPCLLSSTVTGYCTRYHIRVATV